MSSKTVRVVHDADAESPRTWGNLGVMACWHNRHNLGDVQPKQEPAEWLKDNAPDGSVVLPLFLLDHSGLRMQVGSFHDPWDSGQVGWIVATPQAIRDQFKRKRISKKTREAAEARLRSEVDVYDDFLSGNVWGYVVDDVESGDLGGDSCFGFFGNDLDGMKHHLPEELHPALEEAWQKRGER